MRTKKTFFPACICALFLFTGSVVRAQDTLPNLDFEHWSDFGAYIDPTGWSSGNFLTEFGVATSVYPVPDAQHGNYAIQVSTQLANGTPVPGFAFHGILVEESPGQFESQSGLPFTDRPDSISGWFKYAPAQANDTCVIALALEVQDDSGNVLETVAMAEFTHTGAVEEYTSFSIPVEYESATTPTHAFILLISSTQNVVVEGSALTVDNLSLSGVVVDTMNSGQPEAMRVLPHTIYPNPVRDQLTLEIPAEMAPHVTWWELRDALGRQVLRQAIQGPQNQLDVSGLPAGWYVYRAVGSGAWQAQGRVLIQR